MATSFPGVPLHHVPAPAYTRFMPHSGILLGTRDKMAVGRPVRLALLLTCFQQLEILPLRRSGGVVLGCGGGRRASRRFIVGSPRLFGNDPQPLAHDLFILGITDA